MKRLSAIMIALLSLTLLFGCGAQEKTDTRLNIVSGYLGADCSGGKLVEFSDSHGGMQGDGALYAVIDFKSNPFSEEDGWKPLPASENTADFLWGGKLAEVPAVPEVSNGLTKFWDRHDDADDETDDSELFDRYSINATVGLYDLDNDRLYVIAYDS